MPLPTVEIFPPAAIAPALTTWTATTGHAYSSVTFSGSMEPYLHGGEYLFMEKYTGQPLQVGDLIVFARWDSPHIVHQLVELSATQFKAKGTANAFTDGWYPFKRIKFIVRRVGRVGK